MIRSTPALATILPPARSMTGAMDAAILDVPHTG